MVYNHHKNGLAWSKQDLLLSWLYLNFPWTVKVLKDENMNLSFVFFLESPIYQINTYLFVANSITSCVWQ